MQVYLENILLSVIKGKINVVPFHVILDGINTENIAKMKLEDLIAFKFICSVKTK